MVRHTVMWKLKDDVNFDDVKKLKELSETLKNIISVKEVIFEINPLNTSTYDMYLMSIHENAEELKNYSVDPIHVAFGTELKKLVSSRVAFDFEF